MRKRMRKERFNFFNLKPGFSLTRDSDGDGKPDWIDCQPHNPRKQDDETDELGYRIKKTKMKERLTREEMIDYRDNLRKMARSLEYTNIPDKIKERERLRKWAEDVDDEIYD